MGTHYLGPREDFVLPLLHRQVTRLRWPRRVAAGRGKKLPNGVARGPCRRYGFDAPGLPAVWVQVAHARLCVCNERAEAQLLVVVEQ